MRKRNGEEVQGGEEKEVESDRGLDSVGAVDNNCGSRVVARGLVLQIHVQLLQIIPIIRRIFEIPRRENNKLQQFRLLECASSLLFYFSLIPSFFSLIFSLFLFSSWLYLASSAIAPGLLLSIGSGVALCRVPSASTAVVARLLLVSVCLLAALP